MLQSSSTDYAENNSGQKILDQIILNRIPVQEALRTFGWNPYVKDGFNTNKARGIITHGNPATNVWRQ